MPLTLSANGIILSSSLPQSCRKKSVIVFADICYEQRTDPPTGGLPFGATAALSATAKAIRGAHREREPGLLLPVYRSALRLFVRMRSASFDCPRYRLLRRRTRSSSVLQPRSGGRYRLQASQRRIDQAAPVELQPLQRMVEGTRNVLLE